MIILVNLRDTDLIGADDNEVFEYVRTSVCEACDADKVAGVKVVFGSADPNAIMHEATCWNGSIRARLQHAANRVLRDPQSIALDTDGTCELYHAAAAADDRFRAFGERAILMGNGLSYDYLSVVMTEKTQRAIESVPEDWALVTVVIDDHVVSTPRTLVTEYIGYFGPFFQKEAYKDAEKFSDTTVTSGVARWSSNGQVPPADLLDLWAYLNKPFDRDASMAALERENASALSEYRSKMAGHVYTDEERAEIKAALGPDANAVDVITGQQIT